MPKPIPDKGESSVIIDGEERIIKLTLGSQAKIVAELDLAEIADIPQLLRKLDSQTVAVMLSASLVEPMTVEELMGASVPLRPATVGIIQAVNIANWGNPDGPPEPEAGQEEKAETGQEATM